MTLEQKNTDLDRLFSEALGIKRSAVVRRITQVKLMGWEQVLLIAMYARKQYECEPQNFHGRMGFTELLNESAFETLRPHLLPLIDGGMSFLSLMESLKENLHTWDIGVSLYDWFKKEIEDKRLTFSTLSSPYLYSHHALFVALTRLINICQAMLSLGPSQKICDDLTETKLRQVFADEIQHYNTLSSVGFLVNLGSVNESYETQGQSEPITLQVLLEWQKKKPKDVSDLTFFIDTRLAVDMQKIINRFYDIRMPQDSCQRNYYYGEEKSTKFPEWVQQHVDFEKKQYNLCLDFETLNRFMLMGQCQEIGKMLGDVLHEGVKERLKLPQSHTPCHANASPAEWQEKCTVLGLSRIDTVPSRIAAILYFDLQFMQQTSLPIYTACFELKVKFEQKTKREQTEMITTYVIRHCLFNDGEPFDFHATGSRKTEPVVEKFKGIVKPTSNHLADPMMEVWANDTSSKVRTRFKKPLRDFEKEQEGIDKLVRAQMGKALMVPYPLQTGFPAPLWLPQTI